MHALIGKNSGYIVSNNKIYVRLQYAILLETFIIR